MPNLLDIIEEQEPGLSVQMRRYVGEHMKEFDDVFRQHPITAPIGCIGLAEAFQLYFLVKELQPQIIVESGTLHGFSLYFLRKAAPNAEIHSFDPFETPLYTDPTIHYHRNDWTKEPLTTWVGKKLFAFFDDHINQGDRLHEAMYRRASDVVFHDNYTSLKHSHTPLRYCALPPWVQLCYTFENIDEPYFMDRPLPLLTRTWMTLVRLSYF